MCRVLPLGTRGCSFSVRYCWKQQHMMVSLALVLAGTGGPHLCYSSAWVLFSKLEHVVNTQSLRGKWRLVSFPIWLLVMVWLLFESLIIHHWAVWVEMLGEMEGKRGDGSSSSVHGGESSSTSPHLQAGLCQQLLVLFLLIPASFCA